MVAENFKKLKIGVIYGGLSKERPGSLVSGETVFKSLKKQGYTVFSVDPQKENFLEELKKIDIAFLVLHGRYGEDGKIQGLLEYLKIPYTGSGVLASAIGMDKPTFKRLLISTNIPTPKFEVVNLKEDYKQEAERIVKKLGLPLFLKPVSEGGSLGASVIKSTEQLVDVVSQDVKEGYDSLFVEEYLSGRTFSIGLLEVNGKLITLPIMEAISKKEFYDYEAKHDPNLHTYICPAKMPKKLYTKIEELALKVHNLLGCHGFSRVDFIFDSHDNPMVLEVNTLPGLSSQSNMATMAAAGGIPYDELVVRILESVFTKPAYLP